MASAACFALRLHASAAPPRVGLTQALGGRKAFCCCVVRNCGSSASACSALRTVSRRVATSVKSLGALTHRKRHVHRLRKHRSLSSSSRLCMLPLLTGPAESSRGALRHLGFGLSASALRFYLGRLPSRLTSRSSRRRVMASLKLLGMRAILAPIRRVRRGLTPALGGRKAFCKCVTHRLDSLASVRSARRTDCRCVASSSKSAGRALFFTCAFRLLASETMFVCCSFFCAGPAPSETAGG